MATKNSPPRKVYKLADVIRQVQEEKHLIVLEADDGTEFEIQPPELWDDDTIAVVSTAQDPVKIALAVMGDEDYARFREAGGNAMLLQHVLQRHVGPMTMGESSAS